MPQPVRTGELKDGATSSSDVLSSRKPVRKAYRTTVILSLPSSVNTPHNGNRTFERIPGSRPVIPKRAGLTGIARPGIASHPLISMLPNYRPTGERRRSERRPNTREVITTGMTRRQHQLQWHIGPTAAELHAYEVGYVTRTLASPVDLRQGKKIRIHNEYFFRDRCMSESHTKGNQQERHIIKGHCNAADHRIHPAQERNNIRSPAEYRLQISWMSY